jgi:ATP-dependent Clp protease adaptor protein ClpS
VAKTATPVLEPTTEQETRVSPPWRVILHNDDVTTMDFVVWLLVTLFGKSYDDALTLMMAVHNTGSATVTVCPQERAELYVEQVHSLARPRGFPLVASCEST